MGNVKISKDDLIADFDLMIKNLKDIHPDPFFSISEVDFNEVVKQKRNELYQKDNLIDFWKIFSETLAKLNDGHTSVYLPNLKFKCYFPLILTKKDEVFFIKGVFSEKYCDFIGKKIIAINQIPINDIFNNISKYVSHEKEVGKVSIILKKFPQYLAIVYNFQEEFTVDIEEKKGTKSINLTGIYPEDINEYKKKFAQENFCFDLDKKNRIGILKINQFWNYSGFKIFIEKVFSQLKDNNIKDLIIDIRENSGGNSMFVNHIFSYFYKYKLSATGGQEIKCSQQYKDYLNTPFIKNEIKKSLPFFMKFLPIKLIYHFIHPFKHHFRNKPGTIVKINTDFTKSTRENKNNIFFTGNIYTLIGSIVYSSAVDFAEFIKFYEIGPLIGEETGGNPTAFGECCFFNLPNLGFNISISTKKWLGLSESRPGVGVDPDYEVKQTVEDVYDKRDTVMEFTKKLILNKRKDIDL